MASLIGHTVSHYKILEHLGGGGMGVVYKAQDLKLDRPVVLKFLPPQLTWDPEAKERFVHEAKAASALDHQNICVVHDIGETDDGQIFIVMAFYEGETLKKKIERGPLKITEAVDIAIQVAQGLTKAHEHGIIHRDIKPANVMVTLNGVAKIVDFGLAKLTGRTLLTKTGSTLGTAAYMSPEQARTEEVDHRTDIWSLGVLLYEMLTGKKPFESDYEQALVYSILNDNPKPVRVLRAEIPEALEQIVCRAIAKKPEDRFQSADDLLSDLSSYRAGSDLSKETARVSTRRRRTAFGIAGSATIVIAALLWTVFSGRSETIDTVAVLPFTNVSKDPNLEWMCDGLTNEVIGELCRTPGYSKVIAFNSVMEFKNKGVTPEEVRNKLGVVAVLVTRLYQHGDEVSVSTELLDAKEQKRLWGNEYTYKSSEIRTLPDKIVSGVTKALNLGGRDTAGSTVIQHSTSNPDAYRLFLQAQVSYHKVEEKALRRSIALYRSALQLDPNMGSAYAGIASAYCQLADQGWTQWEQVSDSARVAAMRALSLDRNLADAHLALGMIRYNDYERAAAEEEVKSAVRINPLYADCIHWYAHVLEVDGRFDDGIRIMKQAVELEPLSAHYQFCLGTLFMNARRYDEALHELRKVLELDSTQSGVDGMLLRCYYLKGQYDRAIDEARLLAEKNPGNFSLEQRKLGLIYASMGRKDDALKCIRQLRQMVEQVDPGEFAQLYARIGERDSAFAWLDRAYQGHSGYIFYIKIIPEFDSLRGDTRYRELLRKLGFSE